MIELWPPITKCMSKCARTLINDVYALVSKYQEDVVFNVSVVETAVSRCTPAKYINIAKTWVKVPKKKPYEEWREGLKNFAKFFEMLGSGRTPLSKLHQNREYKDEIEWNDKLSQIYYLMSANMLQDWSSYEDMGKLVLWSDLYNIQRIEYALLIAQKQNAISIPYIDGILRKERLSDQFALNSELKQISEYTPTPIFKEDLTPEQQTALDGSRQRAIDDAKVKKDEMILRSIFKNME